MMRTTLTIDDDLAVQIEEFRRRKGLSMKNVVKKAWQQAIIWKRQILPNQMKGLIKRQ